MEKQPRLVTDYSSRQNAVYSASAPLPLRLSAGVAAAVSLVQLVARGEDLRRVMP